MSCLCPPPPPYPNWTKKRKPLHKEQWDEVILLSAEYIQREERWSAEGIKISALGVLPVQSFWFCGRDQGIRASTGLSERGSWSALISPTRILLIKKNNERDTERKRRQWEVPDFGATWQHNVQMCIRVRFQRDVLLFEILCMVEMQTFYQVGKSISFHVCLKKKKEKKRKQTSFNTRRRQTGLHSL